FSFTPPATPELHTLSLHDALPISERGAGDPFHVPFMVQLAKALFEHGGGRRGKPGHVLARLAANDLVHTIGRVENQALSCCWDRSEEHTSELQSRGHLVCRLLLEK